MTFFAPLLLALGLAAAIPLVLHLLQRHQGPRVVFPALRYLRRAEHERATRLRLRQLLLLALRILALVLLAAAAARPFLLTGGRGHHPTALVIILDNSMTSGGVVEDQRILDHLAEAALATLARAQPEDRLWLILAGEPWDPALTGTPDVLAEAVRQTEPAATAADLTSALERASTILAAEADGRAHEVHILSDLRAAAFRPGAARADGPAVLVLEPRVSLTRNRAVTDIEVGGGLPPLAGEPAMVAATVAQLGAPSPEVDSVDVRLVVDGQVRSASRVPAGAVATLPLPGQAAGLVTGHVEIDRDALAPDDRRHFVTEVRRPPAVRLTRDAPYIAEAVAVLADAGRVRSSAAGPDEVVVAPAAIGADALRRGARVVLLPPASRLEMAAANQRLRAAGVPWVLSAPAAGEARLATDGTGLEAVLEDVRLRITYGLDPVGEPGDTVLLTLSTGEPWAVAGATETGRYLLLASPLTPEAGNIPVSAAMLPLLDRAVNAWVAGTTEAREHQPGDVVRLPAGNAVRAPDGTVTTLRVGAGYRFTTPGIYRVLAGDTTVAAFAVNPTAAASDPRPIRPADLANLLPGHDIRTVRAGAWDDAVFHRRLGRDVSAPLLLAAALLLLLETGLAATGRGARTRGPSTAATPGTAGARAD